MAMVQQYECRNCPVKQQCFQWISPFQKEKCNAWTARNVLSAQVWVSPEATETTESA